MCCLAEVVKIEINLPFPVFTTHIYFNRVII